jgi:hypothetical protein
LPASNRRKFRNRRGSSSKVSTVLHQWIIATRYRNMHDIMHLLGQIISKPRAGIDAGIDEGIAEKTAGAGRAAGGLSL